MRKFQAVLILAAAAWPAMAQVWDNTGNKLLNGSYYFREVTFTSNDSFAVYGTINFNNGTYSIDAAAIQASTGSQGPYTTTGTYSLAASGFGFISNSLIGSPIYGLLGANGVFVGSITESNTWDLFVAAPITSQGVNTLNGPYSLSYMDVNGTLTGNVPFGALLEMSSNGSGSIGNVNLTAYADSSNATTQSLSGVNYFVSNNAYVVTFPASSSALVQGQQYLYSTPDGSFVFGGSPNNFDMVVGVRTGSAASFGGLYYSAGIQIDNRQLGSGGQSGLNAFYGSFNANNGVILGHQRIFNGQTTAYGFTYSDSYPTSSGGSYNDTYLSAQFIAGAGGSTQIGVGIGPLPGITVSVRAPSFTGSGVYLNPAGIVSTASYSPFTSGVSPGDFVILEGSNLGPTTLQGASTLPLPTTLDNVKVLINNIPAPISYVRSDQVAVIVPSGITSSIAQFQVINNGKASNVVTEFVNQTTPGVFAQDESGAGYAAALHKDGSLVTPGHPAQIGETVAVFMAGLGTVFPAVLDGVAAPQSPLSKTSNTITASVSGTAATVSFAGLAPGFAGLYQLNVKIPSGLTAGDNTLDISGPDSFNSEAFISVATAGAITAPATRVRMPVHHPGAMRRSRANGPALVPAFSAH